ncbi:hypothetical protein ACQEVC_34310 [Plantactinospora sp. CA-294935]|uniref:hypothetical protein n=1 Tax=Plantactinospora sp. CA-294935 TaxID=3240012 RepID=UPI003D8D3FB1
MSTIPSSPTNTNPAGVGVVVSVAVKAVLVALAAVGWVPITEDAIAEVTLAVAALADVLVYFGIVRPRVNQLKEQVTGQVDLEQTQQYRPPHGTTFRGDRDLR